jgi:hypothetical protein
MHALQSPRTYKTGRRVWWLSEDWKKSLMIIRRLEEEFDDYWNMHALQSPRTYIQRIHAVDIVLILILTFLVSTDLFDLQPCSFGSTKEILWFYLLFSSLFIKRCTQSNKWLSENWKKSLMIIRGLEEEFDDYQKTGRRVWWLSEDSPLVSSNSSSSLLIIIKLFFQSSDNHQTLLPVFW